MKPDDIARGVRAACLEAARQAYEDAGVQGLCAEGRWEAAMSALEAIDVQSILWEIEHPAGENLGGTRPDSAGETITR